MKITELPQGLSIKLLVIIGTQRMEFDITIEDVVPKKSIIYTTPVLKEGKVLTFSAKGIVTHLLVQLPDAKPMIYRNVIVSTMKKDLGAFCYSILSNADGLEFNRRGAFRCSVDKGSVLRVGLEKTTYDVLIRDVSTTGFSFVFDSRENSCEIGEFVHSVLNDFIEEISENFSFRLFGSVVRIQTLENGRVIYGCKLVDPISGIEGYIAKKERTRIQRQRGR